MTAEVRRPLRARLLRPTVLAATAAVVAVAVAVPAAVAVAFHGVPPPPTHPGRRPPLLAVVGDSEGLALGQALQATAPSGTRVLNLALFGCGLAIGSDVSDDPPQPALAMFPACNSATPPSGQWPARDRRALEPVRRGDAVLFVAGTWEVQDILRNGRWVNITEASFRRYELAQLRTLVGIATAHGARLILTTLPAMPGGPTRTERQDAARRRNLYDQLIASVAEQFPKKVSVVDLAAILSPGGVYRQDLDGVEVKAADGLHTPAYAPGNPFIGNSSLQVAETFDHWLSPRIWPLIVAADGSAPGTVR